MEYKDIFGRLVSQISSGRWIITMAATLCLVKLAWTICDLMVSGKVTLETATYVAIVMSILNTIGIVTIFYFQKNRDYQNGTSYNEIKKPRVETVTITTTTTTLPPIK